jgi:hypothetical protein
MTEDLDIFFKDLGVPVVFGNVSDLAILDMPDQLIDSISISTEYTILVKTCNFAQAKYGDAIKVDGVDYLVKVPRQIDDGSMMRITLERV